MCVRQRDVQRVREVAALVLDGMEIPDGVAHEELVDLSQLLERLYVEQSQLTPNAYLEKHGTPAAIDAQVRTFLWYRQFITGSITVLDWGCNHGPDSALLRAWRGDDLQLHGCDRGSSSDYEVFRSFSQVSYSELDSQFVLPYENDQFDAVIASGVIEHVASDMRSLEELHRIVRPAGRLVITFLPNWLSLHELKLRRSGEDGAQTGRTAVGTSGSCCCTSAFCPSHPSSIRPGRGRDRYRWSSDRLSWQDTSLTSLG